MRFHSKGGLIIKILMLIKHISQRVVTWQQRSPKYRIYLVRIDSGPPCVSRIFKYRMQDLQLHMYRYTCLPLIDLDENENYCYGRVYDLGDTSFGFGIISANVIQYYVIIYSIIRAQFSNSTKTRSLYYNNSYLTIPRVFQSR